LVVSIVEVDRMALLIFEVTYYVLNVKL